MSQPEKSKVAGQGNQMTTISRAGGQSQAIRWRKIARRVGLYALVALFVIVVITPIYWMTRSAFGVVNELNRTPLIWFPTPTLQNFQTLVEQVPFVAYLRNSIVFGIATTVGSLFISFLAAYAFARIDFPGASILLWVLVLSMALPDVGTIVPLYSTLASMRLLDTITGLTLVLSSTLAPFTVWVLVSFIKQVPYEIEEAATMDGANLLQRMVRIVLPVTMPGLVTMGLINFINAWNNLLYPLSFSVSERAKTLSVSITEVFAGYSPWGKPWELIMAVGVTMVAPIIVLVFVSQRAIVSGLTRGAFK
jgi:ABC-type glycerol-3-phosphate transport system permease component